MYSSASSFILLNQFPTIPLYSTDTCIRASVSISARAISCIDTTNFHKISPIIMYGNKETVRAHWTSEGCRGVSGSCHLVVISFQNACVCQSTVSASSQQSEAIQRLDKKGKGRKGEGKKRKKGVEMESKGRERNKVGELKKSFQEIA